MAVVYEKVCIKDHLYVKTTMFRSFPNLTSEYLTAIKNHLLDIYIYHKVLLLHLDLCLNSNEETTLTLMS